MSGRSVTVHHFFVDEPSFGVWDWSGTVASAPAAPSTGTISGGGTRFDLCCGSVPFTLDAGSVAVNANGSASLTWSATDARFGAYGETDFRLTVPLSISDVNTLTGLPANLAAISGSFNIAVLIGPTAGTPTRLDFYFGGTLVGSEQLTPQNSPGADWNRLNSTVVPNGSYPLTVQLFTTQSGASPAATASLQITIAN